MPQIANGRFEHLMPDTVLQYIPVVVVHVVLSHLHGADASLIWVPSVFPHANPGGA
tara:strand:- start:277 stop:444 length:168 start_codon:yes stop_codon:yes gene_type:complete